MTDLAHWQRHGVLVTQDCPRCKGEGALPELDNQDGEIVATGGTVTCPTCSGSGKVPADGVERLWRCALAGDISGFPAARSQCVNMNHRGCEWVYVVPVPTDEEE